MAPPRPDPAVVCWRCDDPALNYRVELTELVQHTLILGSTGSGKSTLIIDAIRQLIAHQAQSRENKIGLLILDAKVDDLVARVREAALRAGRTADVLVFGPSGDHGLDLFGDLRGQASGGRPDASGLLAAERVTRQVLLGLDRFGGDNAFWWQSTSTMLNAGFTLLAATEQKVSFADTVEFLRRWFFSPETPSSLLDLVKRLEAKGGHRHPMVATALDQVRLWQNLDARTKSNLQSCLMLACQPLVSAGALRCFSPGSGNVASPAQAATEGRLCVVSVNAMAEPELARFFFRLAAQLFFDAVQQRRLPAPLAGIILDEFSLVVSAEFAPQLATVRSKNSFVLAGAQGIHSISDTVGIAQSRAVLNNFNTTIFMRNREAETAVHALLTLGNRRDRPPRQRKDRSSCLGSILPADPEPAAIEVPVCPVGALGQLSQHQAYIAFADGQRTESPVWFIPWFEQADAASHSEEQPPSKFSAKHVERLMQEAGFSLRWPAEVVMRACALNRRRRRKTMQRVSGFFLSQGALVPKGLDKLPDCWLAALPGILRPLREPNGMRLPFCIDRVGEEDGVLLLRFAQEQPGNAGTDSWDRIRVAVNSGLYPSRWRPLSCWHLAKLRQLHPELRSALGGPGPTIS